MAKKPVFNYKKYLKILGTVALVFGALGVLSAIAIVVFKADINSLSISEERLIELRKTEGMTDDVIRAASAFVAAFASFCLMFEGWLMRRAAKNPEKSTLLLVILVISVVSNITAFFARTDSNVVSAMVSNAISMVINVLALMSVIQLRKEISE